MSYPPQPLPQPHQAYAGRLVEPHRQASVGHITISWIVAVITALYMLPWAIAATRSHKDVVPITLINLFLGWTFFGWVGALVWACLNPAPRSVLVEYPQVSFHTDTSALSPAYSPAYSTSYSPAYPPGHQQPYPQHYAEPRQLEPAAQPTDSDTFPLYEPPPQHGDPFRTRPYPQSYPSGQPTPSVNNHGSHGSGSHG